MRKESLAFFKALVDAPSPSGFEQPAAKVLRDYLAPFVDEITTDVVGSVHAALKGSAKGAPTVMIAGHIDEIGLMVTYITDAGFLAFSPIGGVDAAVLPGSRVRVHTKDGVLLGVVGRMPIHLLDEDERKVVTKMHKLFVDVGLDVEEVKRTVRLGDPMTFDADFTSFGDSLAVSGGFDDKMGTFIGAEVLRKVKEAGGAKVNLVIAGTVQEELGMRGAIMSSYSVDPEIGIAVDVGHATDYPDVDKRRHGDVSLGKGPILSRGANINPVIFERLVEAGLAESIELQFEGAARATGTDANAIQVSRGGKAAALVSVPLRYMHTQTEVLAKADVEATVDLLKRFVLDLDPKIDLIP
jgi:putative aminopeptidase FrvX